MGVPPNHQFEWMGISMIHTLLYNWNHHIITFSTSQLPKVVRSWGVLYILTWKCASRHNGVQFFISHLASWLRTRRFSEPTFWPTGATNHWKNTVFRDFPTFSRICIAFLLILSLLTLLTSAFQLSIVSEVSLLNFLRQLSLAMIKVWQQSRRGRRPLQHGKVMGGPEPEAACFSILASVSPIIRGRENTFAQKLLHAFCCNFFLLRPNGRTSRTTSCPTRLGQASVA